MKNLSTTNVALGLAAVFLLFRKTDDSSSDNIIINQNDSSGALPCPECPTCPVDLFGTPTGNPRLRTSDNSQSSPYQSINNLVAVLSRIITIQPEDKSLLATGTITDYEVVRLYTYYMLHITIFGHARGLTGNIGYLNLQSDVEAINSKHNTRFPIY